MFEYLLTLFENGGRRAHRRVLQAARVHGAAGVKVAASKDVRTVSLGITGLLRFNPWHVASITDLELESLVQNELKARAAASR